MCVCVCVCVCVLGGEHYYISNAMQTTALMMYDSNAFFYVVQLFLMALQIS